PRQALARELHGLVARRRLAQRLLAEHLLALLDRLQHRVHLAALALGGDDGEELPDVREALEVLAALAAPVEAADDAPVLEGAEAHAGVSAADAEALHDVVGAKGLAGDVEQRVYLRHGAVDAPGGAHLAPAADEEVLHLLEALLRRAGPRAGGGRCGHGPGGGRAGGGALQHSDASFLSRTTER